jgi:hypothetical protein
MWTWFLLATGGICCVSAVMMIGHARRLGSEKPREYDDAVLRVRVQDPRAWPVFWYVYGAASGLVGFSVIALGLITHPS